MGALSHYFEQEGIATTGLSLIRPHTETIRPPRALWVPFDLGRPLGSPTDPEGQRAVLRATLALLARMDAPVLVDWTGEVPEEREGDLTGMACSIPRGFGDQALKNAVREEIMRLRVQVETHSRSNGSMTAGALGMSPAVLTEFVLSYLDEKPLPNPRSDLPEPHVLKLAVDDLLALYQLGAINVTSSPEQIARWFWHNTALGRAIQRIRERQLQRDDPLARAVAYILFAPFDQTDRPVDVEGVVEHFPWLMPK